jgi:hypothetical protein
MKPELYDFNITLPINPTTLRNVKVATFYDYRLRGKVMEDMVSMAWADINTPIGAGLVYLDG